MRMLVLGAGLQGSACAYDLLQRPEVHRVTLADLDPKRMAPFLKKRAGKRLVLARLDATQGARLRRLLQGHNAVLNALPYYFRLRKIGPLVGTRTWGGLVGTLGTPATIDGGGITAPSLAFYDLAGKWAVENEGVAPDIEVQYTPAEVIKGHDPQLERAVQEAMKLLEQNPVKRVPRPAPIDRISKPRTR